MTRFQSNDAYNIIQRATLQAHAKDWQSFVHKILELLTIHTSIQWNFTYTVYVYTLNTRTQIDQRAQTNRKYLNLQHVYMFALSSLHRCIDTLQLANKNVAKNIIHEIFDGVMMCARKSVKTVETRPFLCIF